MTLGGRGGPDGDLLDDRIDLNVWYPKFEVKRKNRSETETGRRY